MWNLKQLQMENILSFEKETIVFTNNQLTLIQGVNMTDSGTKSNGSGKSTILECIKLALTTNTIKKINKVDIIRNSDDVNEGFIELQLFNDAINEQFIIKKYFHKKKSNKCELFENGVLIDRLVDLNISESDKYILSKIGVTASELDNYFLISKEKYVSFFNSPDRDKKELLNQFSKTDKLEKINDLIKADYAKFEAEKTKSNNQINIFNSNKELINKQIEKLADDKISLQNQIDQLNLSILENQNKIDSASLDLQNTPNIEFDSEISSIEHLKSVLSSDLLKQKENALNALKIDQQRFDGQLREVKKTINDIDVIINQANIDLKSTITCPKCSYEFIINNAEKNVEEIKSTLQDCLDLKQHTSDELKSVNEELSLVHEKMMHISHQNFTDTKEMRDLAVKSDTLKSQKIQHQGKLTNLQNTFKSLMSIQESYLKQLDQVKKSFVQDKESEYKLQLDDLSNKILGEEAMLTIIDQSINELSKVEYTLNSFRANLANNSLEYIQQKANEFMEKIKCSYKIIINGYKLLSTGKIKDEISIAISRDGVSEESFGRFSSGEKIRADISCILALNEIINYNVSPNGLNAIFLDEITESLDEEGVENIISALNNLNKTIFLITHVNPDKIYQGCNRIVVQKSNGISKILN